MNTEIPPAQVNENKQVRRFTTPATHRRFAVAAQDFRNAILSLSFAFSIAVSAIKGGIESKIAELAVEFSGDSDELRKFASMIKEAIDTGKTASLPISNPDGLLRLLLGFMHMTPATELTARSFVITMEGQMDLFVLDLVRIIYQKRPDILKLHGRQVRLGEVLEAGTLENYKIQLLEQEIDALSRRGHAAQIDWLQERMGIELVANLRTWSDFMEIAERRNLYAHTNGRISQQYLDAAKKHGFKVPDGVILGDKICITDDYFKSAYEITLEHGLTIWAICYKSTLKSDTDETVELARILGQISEELHYHGLDDLARRFRSNNVQHA